MGGLGLRFGGLRRTQGRAPAAPEAAAAYIVDAHGSAQRQRVAGAVTAAAGRPRRSLCRSLHIWCRGRSRESRCRRLGASSS
eukprot:scaffold55037_cov75-Phaeocystis_antarctica.AAC.2